MIGTLEEFSHPPEHASLIRLLRNLDHTPLLGGNDVRFYTRAAEKFEELLRDIEMLSSIHVEYYVFEGDNIGRRIRDA